MMVSPLASLGAKIFRSQVAVASLWALLMPVRSIFNVSVPGISTLAGSILMVWVSVITPSFTPVAKLLSASLVAKV